MFVCVCVCDSVCFDVLCADSNFDFLFCHNRLIFVYSNGKQSLSLNILLLTQFPLCCVVGFSLATCLLYLSYMLGLMGDYVATAQIAGYFLLCFSDFITFVNSLFALIYREVIQHMRVQESDFALRTAWSLSLTAFDLLRGSFMNGRTERETPPKV